MVRKARRRRFEVTMTFTIELGEDVIERGMSDEFTEEIYRLGSPARVAEHFAFNLVQRTSPSSLDGFADRDDWHAAIDWQSVDVDASEVDRPIKRKGTPRRKTG
jgi:hypothetical protein